MFENILVQSEAIDELQGLIGSRSVPSSMLFYGPTFSGKLTTALEFARSITCEKQQAEWNCPCGSCADHRLLIHHSTKLLGPRNFTDEIAAARDVFERVQAPSSYYMFVRAIRKLVRRFDPELWDPSDRRYKAVATQVDGVNELIDEFVYPELPAASIIEKVVELCRKIAGKVPGDSVPVEQIRRVASWVHTTGSDAAKCVVITGSDRLSDSSRNALLKLLEEPPPDTYIVLIAKQRETLIPTLRSRLRPVRFRERSESESREVLDRIFRESSGEYASVRDYFLAWHLSPEIVYNESKKFIDAVTSGSRETFFDSNDDLSSIVGDSDVFRSFLEQLLAVARDAAARDAVARDEGEDGKPASRVDEVLRMSAYHRMITETFERVSTYNVKSENALEALYYSMRSY